MSKIGKYAIIIALFSLLSRVMGFFREVVIANNFGVSSISDAYFIAMTIPTLMQVIVGGAFASIVMPIMADFSAKGQEGEGLKVGSRLILLMSAALVLTSVIFYFIPGPLIKVIAPDLVAETYMESVKLFKGIVFITMFITVGSIMTSMLQFKNDFFLSSVSLAVMNLISTVLIYFLHPYYGSTSIAIGLIAASVISFAIQWFGLKKFGVSFRVNFLKIDATMRSMFSMSTSLMIASTISQSYMVVNRILASGLSPGKIAALNYGEKVMQLPLGIFAQSVGMALFPLFSKFASENDQDNLGKSVASGVKWILSVSIPIMVMLILLSHDIIAFLFGRGKFNEEAVTLTSQALTMYSLALLGQGLVMLLARMYYAIKNTRTPMYAVLASLAVNLVCSIVFVRYWEHAGLALANSLSSLVNAGVLLFFLKRNNIRLFDRQFGLDLLKYAGAFVLTFGLSKLFVYAADTTSWTRHVLIESVLVIAAYAIVLKILRIHDLDMITNKLPFGKKRTMKQLDGSI